jgi:Tfp pilus assembly major pilin PilA
MCRKGLTVLEILIIACIIGTTTTIGIPLCKEISKNYRNTVHETAADALMEYVKTHNSVPGIMS